MWSSKEHQPSFSYETKYGWNVFVSLTGFRKDRDVTYSSGRILFEIPDSKSCDLSMLLWHCADNVTTTIPNERFGVIVENYPPFLQRFYRCDHRHDTFAPGCGIRDRTDLWNLRSVRTTP